MTRAIRLILPGALCLSIAGAALADPSATPTDPTASPPPPATMSAVTSKPAPEDKVICKFEVPTGSRLGGHKTCLKKSEWDAQAADARHVRDFSPPAGIGGSH